jgi:hypothetical protein
MGGTIMKRERRRQLGNEGIGGLTAASNVAGAVGLRGAAT